MKTFFFLGLCAFFSVSALGQTNSGYVLSSQPQIFRMADHTEQASQRAMGQGSSLMERSQSTSAQGERPLWEAMQAMHAPAATPLGDLARELKKEHVADKKAVIVWIN